MGRPYSEPFSLSIELPIVPPATAPAIAPIRAPAGPSVDLAGSEPSQTKLSGIYSAIGLSEME
jgi:hypothetical protein